MSPAKKKGVPAVMTTFHFKMIKQLYTCNNIYQSQK